MFYLIVIIVACALTVLANLAFVPTMSADVGRLVISVLVGTVAVIAVDGISALIIRRLTPQKWFSAERAAFAVSRGEHKLYMKMKVKKWVTLVPELGIFTGFHKDKIQSTADKEYLGRFLLEANYGVVIHLANALLGFVIAFIPLCSAPSVWIPIFAVNFILSLMPVAILRYNSYTLRRLYLRSAK